MNKRVSFPKRYWVYLIMILICSVLLFVNIFRTDSWTGDKPFSVFTQRDWLLFSVFLIEEVVIVCIIGLFVILSFKISKKRAAVITEQWEQSKYAGIKQGDYDHIWFDFWNTERALIRIKEQQYYLYVEEYDERTGEWKSINGVSVFDDIEIIKKTLFDEFDFYCEQNAELDKHGDVKFN